MEIINYRVVCKGALYALFTVYIPKFDLEIAQCKEFRAKGETGDRRWFDFPSYFTEEFGKKEWKPIVRFRFGATTDAFWTAVRERLDLYLKDHPDLEVLPLSFSDHDMEMPF